MTAINFISYLSFYHICAIICRWRIEFHTKMVHWDCPWDVEEDSNILKGIYDYGMGNWEQIKMDTDLNLYNKVCVKELQRS